MIKNESRLSNSACCSPCSRAPMRSQLFILGDGYVTREEQPTCWWAPLPPSSAPPQEQAAPPTPHHYIHTHKRVHKHTYTRTHACTNTHAHSHMHTHLHALLLRLLQLLLEASHEVLDLPAMVQDASNDGVVLWACTCACEELMLRVC